MDKDKRFKLSFDGREFALFIGGLSVICLLFYLYGFSVGKNRAREAVEKDALSQTALVQERQRVPVPRSAGEEKLPVPPDTPERENIPEDQLPEGQGGDLEAADLTFYQTLPDKRAELVTRIPTGVAAGSAAKTELSKGEEAQKGEGPPATAAGAQSRVQASAHETAGYGPAYSVQVSSFRDRERAMALKKRLADMGYRAYVTQSGGGATGPWFRVRVGSFSGKKEAEQAARKIGLEEKLPAFAILVGSEQRH